MAASDDATGPVTAVAGASWWSAQGAVECGEAQAGAASSELLRRPGGVGGEPGLDELADFAGTEVRGGDELVGVGGGVGLTCRTVLRLIWCYVSSVLTYVEVCTCQGSSNRCWRSTTTRRPDRRDLAQGADGNAVPDRSGSMAGRADDAGLRLRRRRDGVAFVLDGRSVRFRNRYVRTPQYRQGEASGRMSKPAIGTPRPGGRLANLGRLPANTANTNLSFHAGDLLALWRGRPTAWTPRLDTLGEHDFGGRLRGLGAFSAHPKWDPATGEMFNFGLAFWPTPRLNCFKVIGPGGWRS